MGLVIEQYCQWHCYYLVHVYNLLALFQHPSCVTIHMYNHICFCNHMFMEDEEQRFYSLYVDSFFDKMDIDVTSLTQPACCKQTQPQAQICTKTRRSRLALAFSNAFPTTL